MVAPRCWGYEDDGTSNGKCKKSASQCRFVHPESADWKLARRLPDHGSRKTGSFAGPSHRRRDSDSWKSSSEAMPPPPAPTATNTIKLPETGNRWGSNASTLGDKPQASGSNTGWQKDNGAAQSTSWSSQSESAAWGKQSSGSGWDEGWEKIGTENTDNGWTGSNSGWGSASWTGETSTHDTKGKGKEREEQDVSMRDPSPPRKTLPTPPLGRFSAKPDTQLSETNVKPRKSSIPTIPRPSFPNPNITTKEYNKPEARKSTTPTIRRPPAPIPKASKKGRDESPPPSHLQMAYKELLADKKVRSRSSSSNPSKYTGPNGRMTLYTDILTYMQEVVVAQIVHQRALSEYNQWRENHQNSPTYVHATPLTRKILEGHRVTLHKKLADAKGKRDAALIKLSELPDWASNKPINDPAMTKEMVIKYTDDLRSWFLDLKMHERLAVEKKEAELKAKSLDAQSGSGPEGETSTAPQPPTAKELLERGNWDWQELNTALKLAEASVNTAAEQVYSSVWTHNDQYLEEHLARVPDVPRPMEEDYQPNRSEDYAALENKMKSFDENLRAQSEQAALAFTRVHDLQYELDGLRAESAEINGLCAEAEKQFVEFEKAKDDLQAEIDSLTAQLQVLHQHQWSPRLSPSELLDTSIQPILDELLPHFQKRMEADLSHILGLLRQRGIENQEEVARQVDEMLKPLLLKTDEVEEICQTFMAMDVVQDPASTSAAQ